MLKEKLKTLIVKEEGKDSKKKIENIAVLILVLIITIIAINAIWNGDKKEDTEPEKQTTTTGKQLAIEENEQEIAIKTKIDKNKYQMYQCLYISKITNLPTKMEILDINKNTTVYILYNEIKINKTSKEDVLGV